MEELERQGGIGGVAKLLACELTMGLDQSLHGDGSVESRKIVYGVNKLPDAEPASFWMLMVGLALTRQVITLHGRGSSILLTTRLPTPAAV